MRRVVHDERRARALVEEAPEAYRKITEVLEDETDLVRPVQRLEPLAVLKGVTVARGSGAPSPEL